MIDSPDFKRKSGMPSEFERRRLHRLMEEFVEKRAQFLSNAPGEVRFRLQGWTVELYQAQPHPVHANRAVRLPVALLQAAEDAQHWALFFRGQSGHWQPYPESGSPAASEDDRTDTLASSDEHLLRPAPTMRLTAALDTIAQDSLGVFW